MPQMPLFPPAKMCKAARHRRVVLVVLAAFAVLAALMLLQAQCFAGNSALSRPEAKSPRAAKARRVKEDSAKDETEGFSAEAERLASFEGDDLFGGRDPFMEFSPEPFIPSGRMEVEMPGNIAFGVFFDDGTGRSLGSPNATFRGVFPDIPSFISFPARFDSEDQPTENTYTVQTSLMRAFRGPDGRLATERFAEVDYGDQTHDVRETHQAYDNSATGIRKQATEQHLGGKAKKSVKELKPDGQELNTEIFKGMDGSEKAEFERNFHQKAKNLPDGKSLGSMLGSSGGLPGLARGKLWSRRFGGH